MLKSTASLLEHCKIALLNQPQFQSMFKMGLVFLNPKKIGGIVLGPRGGDKIISSSASSNQWPLDCGYKNTSQMFAVKINQQMQMQINMSKFLSFFVIVQWDNFWLFMSQILLIRGLNPDSMVAQVSLYLMWVLIFTCEYFKLVKDFFWGFLFGL